LLTITALAGQATVAVALALVAVACAVALRIRARRSAAEGPLLERVFEGVLLALPGGLIALFAFNAGGYFPDAPAFGVIVLLVCLAIRATLSTRPFAGFSAGVAVVTTALALYAAWTLLSATWSHAPSRALIEADRSLLYLLAVVVCGSLPRSTARITWMLRGVALAAAAVAVVALATRLLPDVLPTSTNLAAQRLSFPLTYWNSLGLLAALAGLLCLHFTASLREPPGVRIAAAALLPPVCVTLFFTFSRGAIAAGVIGVVLYAVLARPRGLVSAIAAAGSLTAVALATAYRADLLATEQAATATAVDQGHRVALVVVLCAAGAGLLRALALPVDRRLEQLRLQPRLRRPVLWSAAVVGLVSVLMVGALADVPHRVSRSYERFVDTPNLRNETDLRQRLTDSANGGRVDHWRVALDALDRNELRGHGAGTYRTLWMRERGAPYVGLVVRDAHSLYFENLAELGVVGLALLAVALLTMLVAVARRCRGRQRELYAVVLAAIFTWALHAGVDWDWEMPAVTVWVFALGGLVLARAEPKRSSVPPHGVRLAVGLTALLAVSGPGLILVSERRLDEGVRAFTRGDCRTAIDRARGSVGVLGSRPEPFEILGLCQLRRGFDRLAVAAIEKAVARNPGAWEFRYDLALVRGAAGLDPRPAARAALLLNPRDPVTRSLVRQLRRRSTWRAVTLRIALREGLAEVR